MVKAKRVRKMKRRKMTHKAPIWCTLPRQGLGTAGGLPQRCMSPSEVVLVTPSCLRFSWRWPERRPPPQLCRGREQRRADLIFLLLYYISRTCTVNEWEKSASVCAMRRPLLRIPGSPPNTTKRSSLVLDLQNNIYSYVELNKSRRRHNALSNMPTIALRRGSSARPCGWWPGEVDWYKMWLQMQGGTTVG